MVILLGQVATEIILKKFLGKYLGILRKKLVSCSVSEIITKYLQISSIFADIILNFGRLTIQNSSS